MRQPRTLLVAVDGGPREALEPLAPLLRSTLEDVRSSEAEGIQYWLARIEASAAELVVVGTSDSERGRKIESAARRAARAQALPIAAIEDFPGNYRDVPDGAVDLVLVESATTLERWGTPRIHAEVASPARYDVYRARLHALRAATRQAWTLAAQHDESPIVLWAGQPETDDALVTLDALIPVVSAAGARLHFKAHPRDPGYAADSYRDLLSAPHVEDVTHLPAAAALAAAPRLVATQFSSLAIEAGFYGIPALLVLLPDAGGATLEKKKGYAVPPFCEAGCAALATSRAQLASAFGEALGDEVRRSGLLRCFDTYFEVGKAAAPEVSARLVRLAREMK